MNPYRGIMLHLGCDCGVVVVVVVVVVVFFFFFSKFG
jgi:hypothetical protein